MAKVFSGDFTDFYGDKNISADKMEVLEQMWINRNTQNNSKLKSDKKSCQFDDYCNNSYYFRDNKDKK